MIDRIVDRLRKTVGTPGGFLDGFRYGIGIRETVLPFLDDEFRELM